MEVLAKEQFVVVSGGDGEPETANLAIDSTDVVIELYDNAVAAATDLIEQAANFFGD